MKEKTVFSARSVTLGSDQPGNSLEDRGGAQHEAPGSTSRHPPGSPEHIPSTLPAPGRGRRPLLGAGTHRAAQNTFQAPWGTRPKAPAWGRQSAWKVFRAARGVLGSASSRLVLGTAAVLKGVPGLVASRRCVSSRSNDFIVGRRHYTMWAKMHGSDRNQNR